MSSVQKCERRAGQPSSLSLEQRCPLCLVSTSACQGRRQRKQPPHYLICLCESIACGCKSGDPFLAALSPFPECMESERVPVSQGVVLGSRGPAGLGQNDPQKNVSPGAGRAEAAGSSGAPGFHLPCQCLPLETTAGETGGVGFPPLLCSLGQMIPPNVLAVTLASERVNEMVSKREVVFTTIGHQQLASQWGNGAELILYLTQGISSVTSIVATTPSGCRLICCPEWLLRTGAPVFPLRHQPPPFGQSAAVAAFSRAPAVTFGPPENAAAFGHQLYSASQALPGPGQPFRPNPGENFGHMPAQNAGATPPSTGHLGAGSNPAFGSSLTEPNHSYDPGPTTYYKQVKAFLKLGVNKHQPLSQQHHHTLLRSEDPLSSGSRDVKASGHRHVPAGTPEGVLPKRMENLKSAHANGTPFKPCLPCGGPEGSSSEKAGGGGRSSSKTPLHPPQHGHVPSEPVYPCGICTHEVNDDQDAILCEASCQKWFHRICAGMTESAYGLLTAEASAVWGCDTCMADKDV
ncbi:hypothetical protein E2320_013214 [Naja naja]|nr:hypothetical protein E2320_013214 [Naja naja]